VVSIHWNEDVAADRLDRVVAFATARNRAPSDREEVSKLRIDYPVASPSLNLIAFAKTQSTQST
jgi:hypothetical protein